MGGSIPNNIVIKDKAPFGADYISVFSTSVSECMRLHLGEILEFLTDFHTLAKIKVRNHRKWIRPKINLAILSELLQGSQRRS